MAQCRLCKKTVDDRDPFCRFCGNSRISDSLKAPSKEPWWLDRVMLIGAGIVALAFVFTVGVAFLREARALRWSRAALEGHDYPRAYILLKPFVERHPEHVEALFLSGQASLGIQRADEANEHYVALKGMTKPKQAVVKASELREIYRQMLVSQAGQLACGQSQFALFYETYRDWDEEFHESLLQGAAELARLCVSSQQQGVANEPGFWLIHEAGLDSRTVVDELYLVPARRSAEQGEYRLARQLAMQSQSLEPETGEEIDRLVEEPREKFSTTVENLQDLCVKLAKDPEYRQSGRWCFPETPPTSVIDFRDAWGGSASYEPLPAPQDGACRGGFRLISWAPEGEPSALETRVPEPQKQPPIVLSYRSGIGGCRKERIEDFWLLRKSS